MKAKDLRERPTGELTELKSSLTRDLFGYRMKNAVGQLDDSSLLGKTKKDIARIELILGERSQSAEGEQA
jgi:large subunit ribosomal protein L29